MKPQTPLPKTKGETTHQVKITTFSSPCTSPPRNAYRPTPNRIIREDLTFVGIIFAPKSARDTLQSFGVDFRYAEYDTQFGAWLRCLFSFQSIQRLLHKNNTPPQAEQSPTAFPFWAALSEGALRRQAKERDSFSELKLHHFVTPVEKQKLMALQKHEGKKQIFCHRLSKKIDILPDALSSLPPPLQNHFANQDNQRTPEDKARDVSPNETLKGKKEANSPPLLKTMDGNVEPVAETLRVLIFALVDKPKHVDIRTIDSAQTTLVEVSVAPQDIGKVVGKRGRTAKALRTLLACIGGRTRHRYELVLVEPASRPETSPRLQKRAVSVSKNAKMHAATEIQKAVGCFEYDPVGSTARLLTSLLHQIVDHPDKIQVRTHAGTSSVVYETHAEPDDVPKIIGRRGETAQALRTLLANLGARHHKTFALEIVEVSQKDKNAWEGAKVDQPPTT